MNSTNLRLRIAFAWGLALAPTLVVAAPFSFDDVEYWVGTGANRAALVIDWVENSTDQPALAWGYRWEGVASGRDMLLAIVEADDRLFAKLGDSPANPTRLFGIGYDADNDGEFSIDDGTTFDASGIAIAGQPFFPAASTDADDYYAEGWTFGFWHYGVPATEGTNPYDGGEWASSLKGMAGRNLIDGEWDGWAFTASTTFPYTAYAENPAAAPSPYPLGDYSQDGSVGAEDYDVWKSAFGLVGAHAADGNGDGLVDAADYTLWRDQLSAEPGSGQAATLRVPEPALASFAAALVLARMVCRTRRRAASLAFSRLRIVC